ncbi:P-loop containing nucleoside triphosphate hydrolase protein [Paraphysoderma sedebokerense]|nr:P-loop containing nucleoside triphosphate hydrolase protein [Paraphysoderma sedebokerense]
MSTDIPLANAGAWKTLTPPLSESTLDVLDLLSFNSMTPVQSQAIPLFLSNKDVVVEAITGSGKTLSFIIPIIEILRRREDRLKKNQIGAVIVSPTRELAAQIYQVLKLFLPNCRGYPLDESQLEQVNGEDETDGEQEPMQSLIDAEGEYLTHALFCGGASTSIEDDFKHFKQFGAHIVVGTPGRLEEFFKKGIGAKSSASGGMMVNVKECEVVVLDEADRLLDLGFLSSLTNILSYLPKQRRTGLFSATMTETLSNLIKTGLRNPVRIVVKVSDKKTGQVYRTPQSLDINWIKVTIREKLYWLIKCLEKYGENGKTIVYFGTCHCVEYFYKLLMSINHPLLTMSTLFPLHGQQPPPKRTKIYNNYLTASPPSILLTTDLAARGLDIPNVDFVLQFDPPSDPKMFTHRCGRAGRMGKKGQAIVLLTEEESTFVEFMNVRKVFIAPMSKGKIDPNYSSSASLTKVQALTSPVSISSSPDSNNDPSALLLPPHLQSLHSRVIKAVRSDRSVFDKSITSFVSYIRFYSNNELSYIFRLSNMRLLELVQLWGLLKLPKMPELNLNSSSNGKGKSKSVWKFSEIEQVQEYIASLSVDTDSIKYLDKVREKKRLQELKLRAQAKADAAANPKKRKKGGESWSDQKVRKEKRLERREKKEKKKMAIMKAKMEGTFVPKVKVKNGKKGKFDGSDSDSGSEFGSGSESDNYDEWEELAKEERMAKKVKKGKLSQIEFEKQVFEGL